MEISDLILRKEEILVLSNGCFELPIHPLLTNPEIIIKPNLARKAFPQAVEEWYEDLKKYRETEDLDNETKKWYDNVFLNEKPEVKMKYGSQIIFNDWTDDVQLDSNGFAGVLSISRNGGGTLFFNKRDHNCEYPVYLGNNDWTRYIRFSEEKAREFGFKETDGGKHITAHVYAHHNIDHYPGALFLRNWGILYLNEALKSVL